MVPDTRGCYVAAHCLTLKVTHYLTVRPPSTALFTGRVVDVFVYENVMFDLADRFRNRGRNSWKHGIGLRRISFKVKKQAGDFFRMQVKANKY